MTIPTNSPTENPVLVLMARAILRQMMPQSTNWGAPYEDVLKRTEVGSALIWERALSYAQAAFSVLPVERGSDGAGRSERPQEASPERWSSIESAPKDFMPILGWDGRITQWYRWVNDRHAGTGWFNSEQQKVTYPQPFLWMHVPHPADGDNQSPSVDPSAPLSEPIDFPSNNTEGERL